MHRPITLDPLAFRGLGLPVGPDRQATERGIVLQVEAGLVGLTMDTGLPARLVAGWIAWGGEARGPLGAYLGEVLDGALPKPAR